MYHELFDGALERYNAKQTRKDRKIGDYYEKIRSGKQEKPFHEIILQIGNKDDMGAETAEGQVAARILDEYMKGFQKRNPTLRVFSTHLHMDEATPHLHIDFVPYITRSKRGLDTRVSLKQALLALGFKGGTRMETELNQWVTAEKQQLASIMLEHGIEWEQKGTHEKHLSLLDFEKQERAKEVAALEKQKAELEAICWRLMKNGSISWKILNGKYPLHMKIGKRGFKTKKEALKFEKEFLHTTAADMDMQMDSFINIYFEDKKNELKANSVRNKRFMINKHIMPYFGTKK